MPCGLACRAKAKVLQLDYVGGANRASRGSESEAHFESSCRDGSQLPDTCGLRGLNGRTQALAWRS